MAYEKEQDYLKELWAELRDSDVESCIDSESEGEEGIMEPLPEQEVLDRNGEQRLEPEENIEEENQDTPIASEDEEDIEPENDRYYLDKNKTKWFKAPLQQPNVRTRSENIITHLPGTRGIAKEKRNPLDCWLLFISEEMLDDIVYYTNRKLTIKASQYNAAHQYLVKETNKKELKAVIGLLYLTGLYKGNRQNTADFWNTDGSGIDLFRTTMSQQRYYILLQCIRFDNIENRAQRKEIDKLAPLRAIFDRFAANCMAHYIPSEYLTIDEKLESFRGRVSFLQYIPNKPSKYGLKVFALVDAKTYYCLNLEVYVGTQPDGPYKKSNDPHSLVVRLIEPVSGTKRNITFDNWFTSYPLMIALLSIHKLTSVGTVRKNKRDIPTSFLFIQNRERHSSIFAFKNNITAVSYVPKKLKNVILFSTLHHDERIEENSGDKKLPEIIDFYNSTKGGVDTLDELSANYNVSRNSRRWPLTLFFSFLNTAGVNAQVIYKFNTQHFKLKRREFLKQLGMQLISEFRDERRKKPQIRRELREIETREHHEAVPKRRRFGLRCSVCPRSKDRKTFYACMSCDVPLCMEHAILTCQNCSGFNTE